MPRKGLLLINLGTPDAPEVPAVRRYLREFLSDPRVLDMNPVARWLLLNLVILRKRPAQAAEAYRQVWTKRGSPLLFHGEDLARKMATQLGNEVRVELAMRYQSPSIARALLRLRDDGVDQVVAFPLFPQYSSAAWGSAVEKLFQEAGKLWNVPTLQVVPPYYDHPDFIRAWAGVARPVLEEVEPDHVMLSYHGLPERHLQKSDETRGRHCLQSATCCDCIGPANRNCYRAQCASTSRALTAELQLDDGQWEMTFQSRLGRDPWIQPYTDERVIALAKGGCKRLVVLSPAFTADCLETIEEIGLRARDSFVAHGGEELRLVPSLNAGDAWVDAVIRITSETVCLPGVTWPAAGRATGRATRRV